MAYSDFTIGKVKQAFGLNTVEGVRFLPTIEAIVPSLTLTNFLAESLPVAVATGSEKARSPDDYLSCPSRSQKDPRSSN